MKRNIEENIYIRIIKFGIEHPEGFNFNEIIDNKQLKLNDQEKNIVDRYLNRAYKNEESLTINSNYPNLETLFLAIETTTGYQDDKTKFIINLDSQFKYIDYLELKENRKIADRAQLFAISAIIISVISLAAMLIIAQTVKIDQQQYNEIKNLIIDKND